MSALVTVTQKGIRNGHDGCSGWKLGGTWGKGDREGHDPECDETLGDGKAEELRPEGRVQGAHQGYQGTNEGLG